ncbi:MAG: alpha-amylase, partial [Halioglobus sp.]|nr:alpha-amylase [Halioglobus sp.]
MMGQPLLLERVERHLEEIYGEYADRGTLARRLLDLMRLEPDIAPAAHGVYHWSQRDALVITYGDSLLRAGEKPLHTLK